MIFVPAVAYHICLNLPAAFSQPGNGLIVKPCIFTYGVAIRSISCFSVLFVVVVHVHVHVVPSKLILEVITGS